MDANNWCNLRLINSTVCEANKFTTPEGIGILFAKHKFLFGEISGIYKLGFEKTFCSIKHVERSLFARLFPCRFYMHVIWRHGMRMGLCM